MCQLRMSLEGEDRVPGEAQAKGRHGTPRRSCSPRDRLSTSSSTTTPPTSTSEIRACLDRHSRWACQYVPTSCSWLNAVEGLFRKALQTKAPTARFTAPSGRDRKSVV